MALAIWSRPSRDSGLPRWISRTANDDQDGDREPLGLPVLEGLLAQYPRVAVVAEHGLRNAVRLRPIGVLEPAGDRATNERGKEQQEREDPEGVVTPQLAEMVEWHRP